MLCLTQDNLLHQEEDSAFRFSPWQETFCYESLRSFTFKCLNLGFYFEILGGLPRLSLWSHCYLLSHHIPFGSFSSVQFSHSVVSDCLQPHGLQHARHPRPSPTPGVYSNSHPLSWWCHPTTSSSIVPFSSCPQSLPASGPFHMSQFLHIRWPKHWSFSFSISPSNGHSGLISFRKDWLDLLVVQGTLRSLCQHHSFKASIFRRSAFFTVQLSHPYMTTGKTIALTRRTFVGKVMSLLFNMLSAAAAKSHQ